jgi:HD-like signal output (HDOD) protein
MSDLVTRVRKDIMAAIDNDRLTLPTLPEVALKVREVAEDPEATIADLTKVIANDAALTARIIRVTNSPLLRAPQEVKDLTMAISRLGMNYTANLAIGLAMEQMFQATSDMIDQRMRQNWSSTTKIATLSYVLAQEFTQIPPDEAILAALVHRLGVLPILTYAEEQDDLIQDSISLDQVTEQLHPELGKLILEKWDFPDSLYDVPLNYAKFEQPCKQLNHVDIVRVATLLYYQGQQHPIANIDWSTVPAVQKMGLSHDPSDEKTQDIVQRANEAQDVFV